MADARTPESLAGTSQRLGVEWDASVFDLWCGVEEETTPGIAMFEMIISNPALAHNFVSLTGKILVAEATVLCPQANIVVPAHQRMLQLNYSFDAVRVFFESVYAPLAVAFRLQHNRFPFMSFEDSVNVTHPLLLN